MKWIESRYPLTRARTSTDLIGSSLAVKSSHSVTSFNTGCTVETSGGGGATGFGLQPENRARIKTPAEKLLIHSLTGLGFILCEIRATL
ncbi:MAG: hypothetical protein WAM53_04390 [Terrimicrobiaceae bacterium]